MESKGEKLNVIQIQHLLKLNPYDHLYDLALRVNSNTTLVKVKLKGEDGKPLLSEFKYNTC